MTKKPTPQLTSASSSLKPKAVSEPLAAVPAKRPVASKPASAWPGSAVSNKPADLSNYVPDFVDLRTRAGLADDVLKGASLNIPISLFKLLMSDIVRRQPFDDAAYLAANPDVAQAMKTGVIASAHDHYVGNGYFEGRNAGSSRIDEIWYLRNNPDVATAVRNGAVKSAVAHYDSAGRREGRTGSAEAHVAKSAWDAALNKR